MVAVKGYFNGQNYVVEDNVDVKENQCVIITLLDEFKEKKRDLKKYVGKISKEDSDLISQAVSEGRKVDESEW